MFAERDGSRDGLVYKRDVSLTSNLIILSCFFF